MQKRDTTQLFESRKDRLMELEDRLWVLSPTLPGNHALIEYLEREIDKLRQDERDYIPLF